MKHFKQITAAAIALLLVLTLYVPAFAVPVIEYGTNGAANRYGAGAELMLVGKVTDSGIAIQNADATVSVKAGGTEIHYAHLVTDSLGFFRTRISVPATASGTLLIEMKAAGESASWSPLQPLGNPGSVKLQGYVDCVGYREGETPVLTPAGTSRFGILFVGNVNYYNNRNVQGDLGLESLGFNERNRDCFTLYKKVADGSFADIGCSVDLVESDAAGGNALIPMSRITPLPGVYIDPGPNNGGQAYKDTIFVTPGEKLQPNTTYKLVIDKKLSQNSSATLGKDEIFYFTTAASGSSDGAGGGAAPPAAEQAAPPVVENLPAAAIEAAPASEEQTKAAEEAVSEAAAQAASASGVSIMQAGDPVAVSAGEGKTVATLTLPDGTDTSKITTMAALNENGALTPVPTRVDAAGNVIVLISGDVVLVPLNVSAQFNDTFFGAEFTHVTDEINRAASLMIADGQGSGVFNPSAAVTAGEAATMLLRAMGAAVDWNTAADAAAAHGLIAAGVDIGEPMSRIDTAGMIVNALKDIGMQPTLTPDEANEILSGFTDLEGLSDAERVNLAACVKLGIFKGAGNGLMNPSGELTRAQTASLAVRLQDVILGV
ncbi:MAG: S-layer homology domain-containing protein [Oscillospiraceae bacterium]|nr:S-layer homology domain-containing protein [Oscillospiraceae bacterium]